MVLMDLLDILAETRLDLFPQHIRYIISGILRGFFESCGEDRIPRWRLFLRSEEVDLFLLFFFFFFECEMDFFLGIDCLDGVE